MSGETIFWIGFGVFAVIVGFCYVTLPFTTWILPWLERRKDRNR